MKLWLFNWWFQLLLDQDPTDIAATVEMFNILKNSNSVRVDILTSLLQGMGYNCDRGTLPQLTPTHILTKNKVRIMSG